MAMRHENSKTPLRVAFLGNPNCGKTALFNLLTGSRQKVANYAGVTVERFTAPIEDQKPAFFGKKVKRV